MDHSVFQQLPGALLPWFRKHQRPLPWRQTREPYRIWLSEIMLQQTRVEAVKGYYARFLAALPDVGALANADDELLNKLWEGLGEVRQRHKITVYQRANCSAGKTEKNDGRMKEGEREGARKEASHPWSCLLPSSLSQGHATFFTRSFFKSSSVSGAG